MSKALKTAATAAAFTLAALTLDAGAAHAACEAGKPRAEMTYEDAQALYDCIEAELHAGYMDGPKRWIPEEFVADYRGWTPVSRLPADPGFHGERYLLTFVNETGAAEYLEFAEERGPMPEGTVIAKESFAVSEAGVASPGPLFIMQKVAPGTSPATNDWYYMMVGANGRPQAVPVETACSQCHNDLFGMRDGLGYPVEAVRAGN